jgi:hypothetical protein
MVAKEESVVVLLLVAEHSEDPRVRLLQPVLEFSEPMVTMEPGQETWVRVEVEVRVGLANMAPGEPPATQPQLVDVDHTIQETPPSMLRGMFQIMT